tara:strand:+ start:21295 stop:21696 length:402 start_codon:yes stop_codon:yes gene_type:complete
MFFKESKITMFRSILTKIKTFIYVNVYALNTLLIIMPPLAISLYSVPASAQSMCMPRDAGVEQLTQNNYSKAFTGLVVVNNGEQIVLEVYVNIETNSMMLMETSAATGEQFMCLKRRGIYYEIHDLETPGENG